MVTQAHVFEGAAAVLDVETEEALRSAVGAATMLGPDRARALLALSDEQLGHLFKVGIAQVIDLAGTITFGIAAAATRDRKPAGRQKRGTAARADAGVADLERQVQAERRALVADGRLLSAAQTWTGLGMTRQALSKAVGSGRIFAVDVGAAQYYPAFYLAGDVDRKTLGRVTQCLGDLPGWSKWQFFTTPKASLGNVTPLVALSRGKLDDVERAAAAFRER